MNTKTNGTETQAINLESAILGAAEIRFDDCPRKQLPGVLHPSPVTIIMALNYLRWSRNGRRPRSTGAKPALIKRGLLEAVPNVFTPTLPGWDLVDGWLQEQPAPAGIATDQDLDKFQRQMDADRAYGAMLILLGKRKITITEAMDGTHPRHVRPMHRAPPK